MKANFQKLKAQLKTVDQMSNKQKKSHRKILIQMLKAPIPNRKAIIAAIVVLQLSIWNTSVHNVVRDYFGANCKND